MRSTEQITGVERFFEPDEIIVSKTDTGGRITYANDVFIRISGYAESEILNQPHSMIRHPDMPRCIFKLMWETLKSGSEIFAFVNNRCKNGDHYWVLAHVTPTFNEQEQIIGYHSNRRLPGRQAIDQITDIYKHLIDVENRYQKSMEGMSKAYEKLENDLVARGVAYDEFVFSLTKC